MPLLWVQLVGLQGAANMGLSPGSLGSDLRYKPANLPGLEAMATAGASAGGLTAGPVTARTAAMAYETSHTIKPLITELD